MGEYRGGRGLQHAGVRVYEWYQREEIREQEYLLGREVEWSGSATTTPPTAAVGDEGN